MAILLDFDGTLAPITQHPKDTVITEEGDIYLRKLVERKDIFTAIISGRGLPDLKDKVSDLLWVLENLLIKSPLPADHHRGHHSGR